MSSTSLVWVCFSVVFVGSRLETNDRCQAARPSGRSDRRLRLAADAAYEPHQGAREVQPPNGLRDTLDRARRERQEGGPPHAGAAEHPQQTPSPPEAAVPLRRPGHRRAAEPVDQGGAAVCRRQAGRIPVER